MERGANIFIIPGWKGVSKDEYFHTPLTTGRFKPLVISLSFFSFSSAKESIDAALAFQTNRFV